MCSLLRWRPLGARADSASISGCRPPPRRARAEHLSRRTVIALHYVQQIYYRTQSTRKHIAISSLCGSHAIRRSGDVSHKRGRQFAHLAGRAAKPVNALPRRPYLRNHRPDGCPMRFSSIPGSPSRRRHTGRRRRGRVRGHGIDQHGRRVGRWRGRVGRWRGRVGRRGRGVGRRKRRVRWRRGRVRRRGRWAHAIGRDGQEHVMGESRLVGARPAHMHPAALAAGHRGPVGQRHGRMATVPTDHQGIGRRPIVEAPRQQRGFLVAGVEPVPIDRPVSRRIRYPGRQSRTVGTGGGISTRNIRSPGNLTNQRYQCGKNDHGERD